MSRLNAPVSLERFSSSIKMFFDQFEAESGMPVRIASYPSSSCDHDQHFQYGDRKIVRGKTAELAEKLLWSLRTHPLAHCNTLATPVCRLAMSCKKVGICLG